MFNESLAERVRSVLADVPFEVEERRMFGGLAFMVRGYMTVGVVGDDLMVKLGQDGAEAALSEPGVRPMDFTGRPIKSMVFIGEEGLRGKELDAWVDRAVEFMTTQPRRG
jgi:TfoX/Sxy family transcriptional regulator of competence genes